MKRFIILLDSRLCGNDKKVGMTFCKRGMTFCETGINIYYLMGDEPKILKLICICNPDPLN